MPLSVVILAAGKGKRMASSVPKVLHNVGGLPLLQRVVTTTEAISPHKIYVIYGNGGSAVKDVLNFLNVQWVEQEQQLGTGHAVLQALPFCDDNDLVMVLYGDVPLITSETLQRLMAQAGQNNIAYLISTVSDPTGLGRIVRDKNGYIIKIVEQRDANDEQLNIREINTGVLVAPARLLKKWLPTIKNNNKQQEYYLTDIVECAVNEAIPVVAIETQDPDEFYGVNSCYELSVAERHYQLRLARQLMEKGVQIADPNRVDFRTPDIEIGQDVFIDINTIFNGKIKIGDGSSIGANVILSDVEIGANVTIKANSVIDGATIADHCIIGPFARLRPETVLQSHVHVGNFVEVKKSILGERTKANHLTYLGDATIGSDVNIGAGTITCNYDGANKWQTIIHDGAFIGSNVALVAPIEIGFSATVGAGSTLNKNAPAQQLTVSRAKAVSVSQWQRPKKENGEIHT